MVRAINCVENADGSEIDIKTLTNKYIIFELGSSFSYSSNIQHTMDLAKDKNNFVIATHLDSDTLNDLKDQVKKRGIDNIGFLYIDDITSTFNFSKNTFDQVEMHWITTVFVKAKVKFSDVILRHILQEINRITKPGGEVHISGALKGKPEFENMFNIIKIYFNQLNYSYKERRIFPTSAGYSLKAFNRTLEMEKP